MGVRTGRTINYVASLNQDKILYGFDSFEGLPEDWVRANKTFAKGTFGFKTSQLPKFAGNVQIRKGWFNETLPQFVQKELKDTPVFFLHIDCDLYSSTNEVFRSLASNLKDGTIIVFDEYYNFAGAAEHKHRAFIEFQEKRSFLAEYLAFNANHQQVVVCLRKT